MSDKPKFWFNPKTKEVEVGPKSIAMDRIGPFDTREQAERAEEIIRERARRMREEEFEED